MQVIRGMQATCATLLCKCFETSKRNHLFTLYHGLHTVHVDQQSEHYTKVHPYCSCAGPLCSKLQTDEAWTVLKNVVDAEHKALL